MNTDVSAVRIVRARWRCAGSDARSDRCSDIATNTRPVKAAAPPPTITK
jgi:hypothetical protein